MQHLSEGLLFDYVPIKSINVGRQNKDWLQTDTFIDIVSKLLRDEDVKRAGGFMVIRPRNYKGSEPFLYPSDYDTTHYNHKHYDMACATDNLFGIQNLKSHFKAQIHDQRCQYIKPQLWKWNKCDNKDGIAQRKHRFDALKTKKTKKKKKKKRKKQSGFEVISGECGQLLTQTQSGRIIKINHSATDENKYKQLDRYLEGIVSSDADSDSSDSEPPKKKRKTNANASSNHTGINENNRGFAIVIEQIERKEKEEMKLFWSKQEIERDTNESDNEYTGVSAENIPLLFCERLCLSQRPIKYGIIDRDTLYHFESPLQLSHLSRYGPFSALNINEQMLGIEMPYAYIGKKHTFFPFHREDMALFAVNHLLWGMHKVWYCVKPSDSHRVLAFIRQQYREECSVNGYECETPLQHKLFWFDPYILLSLGIPVYFIRQKPGDIVITPPGGIHGGLNTGPNVAESINFMTYDIEQCWKPILSAMLYYCNNFKCRICINHAFLDINRLAERLRSTHKDIDIPTQVISKPLPINDRKYTNADTIISRSFNWNNRGILQSRYLHSNEYKLFANALNRESIYPYFERIGNVTVIYPIKYKGSFDFKRDQTLFVPVYSISFFNHCKSKKDVCVELSRIFTPHRISVQEWNQRQRFDEQSIRLSFNENDKQNVTFSYSDCDSQSYSYSAQRRRKIKSKRIIVDSDTESD